MKQLLCMACLVMLAACTHEKKENSPITITATEVVKPAAVAQPALQEFRLPGEAYQSFSINNHTAQTVSGNSGTLLLIPAEAFSDRNGKIINERVTLKMVEGVTKSDMVKFGLSTMSENGVLESGGMINLQAFSPGGDTLVLTKGKSIEVEIPTEHQKEGMQLWEGITTPDGQLSWKNPQALPGKLRPVPLEALEEPEPAALNINSFPSSGGWSYIRTQGTDTIFWISNDTVLKTSNDPETIAEMDEIRKEMRQAQELTATSDMVFASTSGHGSGKTNLQDKRFENTVIATAEFRSRLPYIKQACDAGVLDCYTSDPQRELWKSDAAAADYLDAKSCPLAGIFRGFSKTKSGKVDEKDKATKEILDNARSEAIRKYRKLKAAQMKEINASGMIPGAYSFRMTTLGWANIDRLAFGPDCKKQRFNVFIKNAVAGEQIETALIVSKVNCYIPGYRRNNGSFAYTHGEFEPESPLPQGEYAYVLVKSKSPAGFRYALQQVRFGDREDETVTLIPGSAEELDKKMAALFGGEHITTEYEDFVTNNIRNGNGCICSGASGK